MLNDNHNIGYVHVYTGNGKGKTTAAAGLALRAAGAGKKVFIGQFVKGKPYSENEIIRNRIPEITVCQYGRGCFIYNEPTAEDIAAAKRGLEDVRQKMNSGAFEVMILDEINIATFYRLISAEEVLTLIREKPSGLELVLTGRYASAEVTEAADLVTEMTEVKHYYSRGIEAREGIEY
ncbi:MAG: cob(I)yrinic acid a,c-diamide adenosyltransferase [Bacteroidales bacterium]|nr:cob(I)yrinic acid a,c-diamide adenosyltransferase [Bacteroidales bacterium]